MKVSATLNKKNEIDIIVALEPKDYEEKVRGGMFDLNYLLKTKLYKAGYPVTEENRVKVIPKVII